MLADPLVATLNLPTETLEDEGKTYVTRYTPHGIVGAISPWNFLLILSTGKTSLALVTGNCIIAKPFLFTPYTALNSARLLWASSLLVSSKVLGGDDKLGPWVRRAILLSLSVIRQNADLLSLPDDRSSRHSKDLLHQLNYNR